MGAPLAEGAAPRKPEAPLDKIRTNREHSTVHSDQRAPVAGTKRVDPGWRQNEGTVPMTFAFATLAFLAAAWLAIVVFAGTVEDYGMKVRAALSGTPPQPWPAIAGRMSPRYLARRTLRPQPRLAWRAAA
jgi:hypothetical protein